MPPRKRVLIPPSEVKSAEVIPFTPKTTPKPSNKIAIVGAWPEHWHKAPYGDDSWEIWAMSAGMWKKHPRFDLWFELHPKKRWPRYEAIAERKGNKGYIEYITKEAVTCDRFPFQKLLTEFGPYFFSTGQVPWMLAYAITLKPETIGIWGVEAWGEYTPQRKDVQHFVQVARDRGIKIEIPDGCTLLNTPKLYAFSQA